MHRSRLLRRLGARTTEDAFRGRMRLYGRYAALVSDVSRFGADFAPTAQQVEVYQVLNERLEGAKVLMDELLQEDLPRLNEILRARGIPVISSGGTVVSPDGAASSRCDLEPYQHVGSAYGSN